MAGTFPSHDGAAGGRDDLVALDRKLAASFSRPARWRHALTPSRVQK